MKHIITTLIWLVLIPFISFKCAGCTQIIIEDDRLKINTFLMTSGLETLYYEPDSIFEVGKYRGIPSDTELEIIEPKTGIELGFKTEAKEIK